MAGIGALQQMHLDLSAEGHEGADSARSSGVVLRDYQVEAVEAVLAAPARGVRRPLLSMATGLGKTVCFTEVLRRRGGRAIVLVHRDELVQQAVGSLRRAWPDVSVGIVKGKLDERSAHVVVASVQSLHAKRLARFEPGEFHTVVVDEAHHAVAPTYQAVLRHLAADMCLGVTATPYRGDLVALDAVFDEIVAAYGILQGIQSGWLVDIESYRVASNVGLDGVHTQAGDFRQGELEEAVDDAERNAAIVDAYRQLTPGRRCIAFAVGVAHAHHLAKAFENAGIRSAAVSGSTPDAERKAMLAGLADGSIPVVTNCGVLTEGFDCPAVETIILARPTKSLGLFTQMVGRGVRPHPGKKKLTLIDVVDATSRHKIVTVAEMIGLRKVPSNGATVTAAIAHEARVARRGVVKMFEGAGFTIQRVDDVVAKMDAAGPMPEFDWKEIQQELDDLKTSVADGTTVPASWWEREITPAQTKALVDYGLPTAQVRSLTRGEASWIIDSYDRRVAAWLKLRGEVWSLVLGVEAKEVATLLSATLQRRRPATPKQLRYLAYLGVKVGENGLTQGEASTLIERVKATRSQPERSAG